ncbi:MAG: uroporphyrinogen decarboxylase family protein, partial [Alphaproteobacteria bacterium]
KEHSMISPAMVRRHLLPIYTRWGETMREVGVQVYGMDSNGYIGELIPIWLDAGINECDPIEVAAGNNLVEYCRKFGKNMAYRGGVDKRAMAKGGKVIEDELARLAPVVRAGGFIPSCDHGVPADVSWPNFVHYVKLLRELTGWI